MDEAGTAPDSFGRAIEVALRIEKASDAPAVVELLEEACQRLGADAGMFLSFIQHDASASSFRYLLACDPCWCVEYEADAWYADDPWLGYARRHSQPTRAAKIDAVSETQQAIMRLAARHGFASAVVVPVPAGGGLSRVGMLCLGFRDAAHFSRLDFAPFKLAAQVLATALHDWMIAMLGKELIESGDLTPDDLVLLEFESSGMGSKRIAGLLGSTPGAIDTRFHRILRKLSVQNRAAAAHLAAEYGLIPYSPLVGGQWAKGKTGPTQA